MKQAQRTVNQVWVEGFSTSPDSVASGRDCNGRTLKPQGSFCAA
jgi:hypothetical protein